jgi:hypothetical protein
MSQKCRVQVMELTRRGERDSGASPVYARHQMVELGDDDIAQHAGKLARPGLNHLRRVIRHRSLRPDCRLHQASVVSTFSSSAPAIDLPEVVTYCYNKILRLPGMGGWKPTVKLTDNQARMASGDCPTAARFPRSR